MNNSKNQKSHRIGIYRSLRKVGVPREEISMDSKFKKDLHFNDVDWNLFFFLIENRMDITLDDQVAHKSETIADFVGWVENTYKPQPLIN
ncbi:MAG: hypothetical protein M0P66_14060 [Salinivirgaceae bacterium]|nr:hypothetical protein [Salinivirgaceae bacterium]